MQGKPVYVVVGTNWSFDDDVPVAIFPTQEAAVTFAEEQRRKNPGRLFYFLVVPFYDTEGASCN